MTAVLVTGGSSGIGLATALLFAARGDRVALLSRSPRALAAAATQCRLAGAAQVLELPADVADQAQVEAAVSAAVAAFGALDVCVHAAAVAAYGRLDDVPAEVFDRVVDVNIKGTVHVARAVLQHFRGRGEGTLILLGSVVGRIATPYMSAYGVTKWAIRGLARMLHLETRDVPGIHVCEVWPGSVNTPVYEQSASYAGRGGRPPPPVIDPDRVAAVILGGRTPAAAGRGRLGQPADDLRLHRRARVCTTGWWAALMGRLGLSRPSLAPTAGNVLEQRPEAEQVHGPWHGPLGRRRRAPQES